jgi:hypothetical protein
MSALPQKDEPLITREQFAARLGALFQRAVQNAIEIGQVFAEAREALCDRHGEWESMCREDLGVDPSTALRFIAISQCPQILHNVQDLPLSWGTLYELVKFIKADPQAFERALNAGVINRNTTRATVKALRELPPSSQPPPSPEASTSTEPASTPSSPSPEPAPAPRGPSTAQIASIVDRATQKNKNEFADDVMWQCKEFFSAVEDWFAAIQSGDVARAKAHWADVERTRQHVGPWMLQ